MYQADPASADWRHLGRLAGFTNQKPERRTIYGCAPWVKVVHARAVLAPARDALIETARNAWRSDVRDSRAWHRQDAAGVVHPAQACQVYQRLVRRWQIAQRFARPDWSIVDLWVARQLLSRGWPAAQVHQIIRLGSPRFPRRHGNAEDYLRRTLERAASPFPPGRGLCDLP